MEDAKNTSVLFVDDEPLILQGLKRQLRKMRGRWDMRFAESPSEALCLLEENPADVVVSDMRMPKMNGAELLTEVQRRYPETVRMILSGQTDRTASACELTSIHQFIQKPCNEDALVHSIERVRALSRLIGSKQCARIAGEISSLPTLSSNLTALTDALANEADANALARIVDADPGLETKVMQLVNSAFFGLPRTIDDTVMAIGLLGVDNLETIAASAAVFDAIDSSSVGSADIASIWKVSADIGNAAAAVAKEAHAEPSVISECRLAGLLSHIGRALFIRTAPDYYSKMPASALQDGVSLTEAERSFFGARQQDLAAYLLGLWGFSDTIIEAVAHQDDPDASNHPQGCDLGNYLNHGRVLVPATQLVPHPLSFPDINGERSAA